MPVPGGDAAKACLAWCRGLRRMPWLTAALRASRVGPCSDGGIAIGGPDPGTLYATQWLAAYGRIRLTVGLTMPGQGLSSGIAAGLPGSQSFNKSYNFNKCISLIMVPDESLLPLV